MMYRHFNLVHQTSGTTQISLGLLKLQRSWSVLFPLYEVLYTIKNDIRDSRQRGQDVFAEVQQHEL